MKPMRKTFYLRWFAAVAVAVVAGNAVLIPASIPWDSCYAFGCYLPIALIAGPAIGFLSVWLGALAAPRPRGKAAWVLATAVMLAAGPFLFFRIFIDPEPARLIGLFSGIGAACFAAGRAARKSRAAGEAVFDTRTILMLAGGSLGAGLLLLPVFWGFLIVTNAKIST